MRNTCLSAIYNLAKNDERIVFIGSDIGYNLIDDYCRELPEQFYMEGIAEQNLVGVAAGMAHEGRIVYLGMMACFFSRAYEQIKLDVALHNLPVRLVGFGAGLTYGREGPTHLALDDIALINILGIKVLEPANKHTVAELMPYTVNYAGPIYIRLGDGMRAVNGLPLFVDYYGTRDEILAHYGLNVDNITEKVNKHYDSLLQTQDIPLSVQVKYPDIG